MKKKLLKLFVILSSALLLVILIFSTDSFDSLIQIISHIKPYWLVAGFGCMVVYWLLDAVILHTVTVTMHKEQRIRDTVRVTMIGQFFNSITPFAGAGQPVQAYVMIKDGVKPGYAASIFVVKSLLHQVIIVLYSMVVFVIKGGVFAARIPQFYYFFVLGTIINTLFLLFNVLLLYKGYAARRILSALARLLHKLRIVKNPEAVQKRIDAEVVSFSGGALILKKDSRSLFILVITQIVQFTFLFAIPYFIQLAVENHRALFSEMISAQALITLISLLVPTPGATGGIEGLSYLFYGMFFRRGFIIPVILIYRLLTYYPSVIIGGIFTVFAPEKPLKREEEAGSAEKTGDFCISETEPVFCKPEPDNIPVTGRSGEALESVCAESCRDQTRPARKRRRKTSEGTL